MGLIVFMLSNRLKAGQDNNLKRYEIIVQTKEVIKYMNSRIPTREEKIELVEYILKHDYKNDENERVNNEGFVESAAIAVFDNYITSSPGYSGKLMVVVYDGSPEMTETYTWVKENESNISKIYRNVAINTSN
jgi:hypothetical protein